MLTVDQALAKIVESAGRQPVVETTLADANGLTLAEAVVADLDSPPFDKALMDGFAVHSDDIRQGKAELKVLGEILAGSVVDRPLEPGCCYQIMTGAPMPPGADAVVMVERSTLDGAGNVALEDPNFRAGQNVMLRGREMTAGETVLEAGHLIGAPEIGLLATIGKTNPRVYRRPRIAILSTGDEIVPPDQVPGPGQIRNSNEATVRALAQRAGAEVTTLGIARDDPAELFAKIGEGLTADVLILTGGVSAGKKDLVPATLSQHGVEQVFHKVEFKPGKPVWFGRHSSGLVFGLPGNPVSVLVCFELFVRTALRVRQGREYALPGEVQAELTSEFDYPTKRLTYHPARLTMGGQNYWIEPVTWHGSPDLRSLTAANALLVCDVTNDPHPEGSWMTAIPLERE